MAEVLVLVALLAVLGVFRGRGRSAAPDMSAWNRTLRDMQAQLDEALTELDAQRAQVAELAERLDFAERRLVQLQTPKPLSPGTP